MKIVSIEILESTRQELNDILSKRPKVISAARMSKQVKDHGLNIQRRPIVAFLCQAAIFAYPFKLTLKKIQALAWFMNFKER